MTKRILALAVLVTFALAQFPALAAQGQGSGVISGMATGPSGPLAGVTVQVVNRAGTVVGSAVTNAAGSFSIGGLPTGTFTVQMVGSTGAVISTTTATLAAGAMTTTVSLNATAAALAGAAGGAGAAAGAAAGGAAAGGGLSTAAIVGIVGGVAAAAGTVAVVATGNDGSPSR